MESKRIALFSIAVFLAVLLLPVSALAQTTHIVTVGDNFFSPSNLTIQIGDTVEWRNAAGGNSHNVTANNGSFSSSSGSQFTFSQTFNATGSVNYRCTFHSGMTGVIAVQGAATVPDIAVQGVDAQNGTYSPGDTISIDIDLENIGNAASGAFNITYYASTNTTINTVDTALGTDARAGLGIGQSSSFTATAEFPDNIAAGNYFIGALVDLSDSNSGNNTNHDPTAVMVEAAPADEPDIAVQAVDAAAGTYEPGDPINIDVDLENIGEAASGTFDITYYASANTTINSGDTELGTDTRPSLNAGQSSSFTANADFPGSIIAGNYFIGAIVEIDDSNNANNVNHDATAVAVQGSPASFEINAGLNDSWFNPVTPGQGFFITVFPDIHKMFLAWFTYDKQRPAPSVTAMLGEPGHRWLTAFGDYSGDTATLAVEVTEGGIFDTVPPTTTQGPDGTITVEFTDCNSAEVSYNFPSSDTTGSVDIQRIALDNVPFCESLLD